MVISITVTDGNNWIMAEILQASELQEIE